MDESPKLSLAPGSAAVLSVKLSSSSIIFFQSLLLGTTGTIVPICLENFHLGRSHSIFRITAALVF